MLKLKNILNKVLFVCVLGMTTQMVYAATDDYVIELKAWIPSATIIDPIEALRAESFLNPTTKDYNSYFLGDNHRYFNGSYRTYGAVSFRWNGTDLSNVATYNDIGVTTLKYNYLQYYIYGFSPSGYPRCSNFSGCWYRIYGEETDTANCCVVSTGVGSPYNVFGITFNATDPLVPLGSPGIDAILAGEIWDGNIQLNIITDKFPSFGVRVFRDGVLIADKMVYDAYHVDAYNALDLAARLVNFTNYKTYNISIPYPTDPAPPPPDDDPIVCKPGYPC